DGYVEIGSLDLIFDKKFVSIKSFFEQGYNLPPKSIIIREITQVGSKNTIEIYLKLGKSEKIFSHSVYEKK
ncbi:MAG: hypothetical protein KAS63_04760, partial [Candidatus Heimdallarchaeota archaeon]|nr:hypothetical protein [Candidatus Heimdallarchaeota archaeon]